MNAHQNARTTPFARALMVERRARGASLAEIATSLGVSARTVCKWLKRHREEGAAGLQNRPSVAHRRPHATSAPWAAMIERLRRLRLTALAIAEQLRIPRSTVSAVLTRLGLGRLSSLEPAEPPRRYERAAPGELLHLDTKKLGRFNRIGHRITGDRTGQSNGRGVGWEVVHIAIDDFSRAAYVEVLKDEKKRTCTAFLVRALRWFAERGVAVQRVMTDNGSGYKSRLFAKALKLLRIRHIRTRPYTPKTNGKAERFIQTLLREWAYAMPYPSSDARAADLPRFIAYYNLARRHGSLGRRPPVTRLPQPA
jgi:transposase InsO family protein